MENAGAPEAQADVSWEQLLAKQCSAATANVDTWTTIFLSSREAPQRSAKCSSTLFNNMDRVFHPNEATDTERKEPISLKKLGQGDGAWSTLKTVLGWNLDTVAHLLRLPPDRQAKVEAALKAIPRTAHTTSLRKWRKLLGML